jgi:hypothetical protein
MLRKKTIRQVKLHSKLRVSERGWTGSSGKIVPWLTINGIWLEEAGFHAGDQVEIEVSNQQLIIKNLNVHGITGA